jgi:hypothetical protein
MLEIDRRGVHCVGLRNAAAEETISRSHSPDDRPFTTGGRTGARFICSRTRERCRQESRGHPAR